MDETLRQGGRDGLRFSAVRHHAQTHYPLTIVVTEDSVLSLRYSALREMFDESTLAELADRARLCWKI